MLSRFEQWGMSDILVLQAFSRYSWFGCFVVEDCMRVMDWSVLTWSRICGVCYRTLWVKSKIHKVAPDWGLCRTFRTSKCRTCWTVQSVTIGRGPLAYTSPSQLIGLAYRYPYICSLIPCLRSSLMHPAHITQSRTFWLSDNWRFRQVTENLQVIPIELYMNNRSLGVALRYSSALTAIIYWSEPSIPYPIAHSSHSIHPIEPPRPDPTLWEQLQNSIQDPPHSTIAHFRPWLVPTYPQRNHKSKYHSRMFLQHCGRH